MVLHLSSILPFNASYRNSPLSRRKTRLSFRDRRDKYMKYLQLVRTNEEYGKISEELEIGKIREEELEKK